MKTHKKAQIGMADMFSALAIFMVLLISSAFIMHDYNSQLMSSRDNNAMIEKALQISDALVKTEGVPSAWTNYTVEIIGLANEDRTISPAKVSNFTNMSIENIERKFELSDYNFYFNLRASGANITKGDYPGGDKVINIRRYVLYDNQNATIDFALWK